MRLVYAVPDHPWIKGGDRADVRIAMTVAERGEPDGQGRLLEVVSERNLHGDAPEIRLAERRGAIGPDLTLGGGVATPVALKASAALCSPGVKLHGAGFIVSPARAAELERLRTLNVPRRPALGGPSVLQAGWFAPRNAH